MIRKFEHHILFIFITLITSVHLYYMIGHYLQGFSRFTEIWHAVYKFLGFLII